MHVWMNVSYVSNSLVFFRIDAEFFRSFVCLFIVCCAASLLICMWCITRILTLLEFIWTWFIWSPNFFFPSLLPEILANTTVCMYVRLHEVCTLPLIGSTDDGFDFACLLALAPSRHSVTLDLSRQLWHVSFYPFSLTLFIALFLSLPIAFTAIKFLASVQFSWVRLHFATCSFRTIAMSFICIIDVFCLLKKLFSGCKAAMHQFLTISSTFFSLSLSLFSLYHPSKLSNTICAFDGL